MDEPDRSPLQHALRIAGLTVLVLLFLAVSNYWIWRFTTYGVIGTVFTILATIAYWTRLRPR